MKRIQLVFLLSLLSLSLISQVHWTKYENNPIMVPSEEWEGEFTSPCSVIYSDSIYHMWYWAGTHYENESIGYATSPDGIRWTKYTSNPVLKVGPEGAWDDHFIHPCTVLLVDSIFHMWYAGHTGLDLESNYRTGHATSPDGVNWSKNTNNPVMVQGQEGEWDELWVIATSVLHDGDNYQMWYEGGGYGSKGWCIRAGHAISPDGVNWMKDSLNPVLSPEYEWEGNMVPGPMVLFDGFNYNMWYAGGNSIAWETGYATSKDGSSWEKYVGNPVLRKGPEGSWDQILAMNGPVIDSAGVKYKMWYMGGENTGYAESDTRDPHLYVSSNERLDPTDTVFAEIFLGGVIYIIPDGTALIADSIKKYMVKSADASSLSEIAIPLTGLSIGDYLVVSVSDEGFVCTNPFLLNVVGNSKPPIVEVKSDTLFQGDTIFAKSNKDGSIYLVVTGTTPENFVEGRVRESVQVTSDNFAEMPTVDLYPNDYLLYAVDIYGEFSEALEVSVEEVDATKIVQSSLGINIFPNPTNKLIMVQFDDSNLYSVEIISLNGVELFSENFVGNSHLIDLSSFQKGVYFITIRSKDFVTTRKVIKL
ncbi:MAG: T9SS type A sorting domain-containing protein [Bacteroidales bacterium]|nr:T9SS type A sorting domain-containing protein [Bacteroidales bacterium]